MLARAIFENTMHPTSIGLRDRMSILLSQFEKIPRRLTLTVFWGGLLMTAGVALVFGGPVFRDLRHQAELNVLGILDGKRNQLDTFFQDSLRAAIEYRYIENSFKVDPELGKWWSMPGIPLEPSAVPDVARVDLSRVKGMVRYSDQQQISGNPFGVSGASLLPPGSQPVLHNLYTFNGTQAISILFPVSKGSDGKDGVDMVFCDASELAPIMAGTDFPNAAGRLALMDASDDSVRFLTPPSSASHDAEAAENLLRKAVRVARDSSGDPWSFVDLDGKRLAVTQVPLSISDWALMLTIPAKDMYRGVRLKMAGMGTVAVVLALFLSSFSLLLSRPFNRFLKRMDHLLTRERSKRHQDADKIQALQHRLTTQEKTRQFIYSLAAQAAENAGERMDRGSALKMFTQLYGAEYACLWRLESAVVSGSTRKLSRDDEARLLRALEELVKDREKRIITDTMAERLPPSCGRIVDQYHWRSLVTVTFHSPDKQSWGIAAASTTIETIMSAEIAEWLVLLGALLSGYGAEQT